jgi:adenylate cyclase
VTSGDSTAGREQSELWLSILNGENAFLKRNQRWWRGLPRPPRCKLCQVPFAGPFKPFLRLAGFGRWQLNQQLCKMCLQTIEKNDGGAEVEVSLLYADIRGSTALAETMPPAEFRKTLDRFYALVTMAIDAEQGAVDHMAGDGVMAFWIPGFVGIGHTAHAVAAGRRIVGELADGAGPRIPAGVAVHTGLAYVGVVGEVGSKDFTVLGDVANTVARLASNAAPGELVMSEAIVAAAEVETATLEQRVLELKGKADPFPVWVETPAGAFTH